MTISQEQFNIAFGVIIAFIVALTSYLNNQASAKRNAQTQGKVDNLQTRVDDVHAVVTGGQAPGGVIPSPPPTTLLVDGHALPIETPPKGLP